MKQETKTIRISKPLHAEIKIAVAKLGMKLEAWTERQLQQALKKLAK